MKNTFNLNIIIIIWRFFMTKPLNIITVLVGCFFLALINSCGASSSGSTNSPNPNNIPTLDIPITSFDISIDKTEFTVSDNAITISPTHDDDARHITQLSTKGNNSVMAKPDEASDINAYFTAREIQLSATGELQIEFSTDIMSTFKLNVSTYLENDLTTVISSQNYIITVANPNGDIEELITTPSIKLYNDSRFTVTGYKLASSLETLESSDITS